MLGPQGIPKLGRGRFDLEAVLPWYMRRLREKAQEKQTPEMVKARVKLLREQARRLHLENQSREAELVDAATVLDLLSAILDLVAAELDRLASKRLARRLAKESDPTALAASLFRECRTTRDKVAAAMTERLLDPQAFQV